MRITSSCTGGIATMPDPVQIPASYRPDLTEVQDLLDRLMTLGVDRGDLGSRVAAADAALTATVTALPARHLDGGLLDAKPADIAKRLRAAGTELAAEEATNQAFHDARSGLVDEVLVIMRSQVGLIAEQLQVAFDDAVAVVQVGFDAGVRPTTGAEVVLDSDDPDLARAYRDLPRRDPSTRRRRHSRRRPAHQGRRGADRPGLAREDERNRAGPRPRRHYAVGARPSYRDALVELGHRAVRARPRRARPRRYRGVTPKRGVNATAGAHRASAPRRAMAGSESSAFPRSDPGQRRRAGRPVPGVQGGRHTYTEEPTMVRRLHVCPVPDCPTLTRGPSERCGPTVGQARPKLRVGSAG